MAQVAKGLRTEMEVCNPHTHREPHNTVALKLAESAHDSRPPRTLSVHGAALAVRLLDLPDDQRAELSVVYDAALQQLRRNYPTGYVDKHERILRLLRESLGTPSDGEAATGRRHRRQGDAASAFISAVSQSLR